LELIEDKLPKRKDYIIISHEQFKKKQLIRKLLFRTGEATPYSNIILTIGVLFLGGKKMDVTMKGITKVRTKLVL